MEVVPRPPTPEEWQRLEFITYMFLTLPLVAWTGAGLLAIAHAIIPSYTEDRHPFRVSAATLARFRGLRPVFYLLAAVFLVGAVALFASIASSAGILWELYEHKWI